MESISGTKIIRLIGRIAQTKTGGWKTSTVDGVAWRTKKAIGNGKNLSWGNKDSIIAYGKPCIRIDRKIKNRRSKSERRNLEIKADRKIGTTRARIARSLTLKTIGRGCLIRVVARKWIIAW